MFEELKQMLVKEVKTDPNKIQETSRLTEDLQLDSIAAVELIMEIEEKYNIEINENDLKNNIKTFGDLVKYVEKEVNNK